MAGKPRRDRWRPLTHCWPDAVPFDLDGRRVARREKAAMIDPLVARWRRRGGVPGRGAPHRHEGEGLGGHAAIAVRPVVVADSTGSHSDLAMFHWRHSAAPSTPVAAG